MANGTKNVKGAASTTTAPAAPAAQAENKGKSKRADYTGGERNENGLLTSCPADYDPRKFKPLKKEHFAAIGAFLEYRALLMDLRAAQITKSANELRDRAKVVGQFKDEETRKRVLRMQRLQKQAADLAAQLKEQGYSIEDIQPMKA